MPLISRLEKLLPRRQPSATVALGMTLGGTVAAAAFRVVIDPLVDQGMAYTVFLAPAALITFYLGWRWGALASLMGGALGLFLFTMPVGVAPAPFALWGLMVFLIVAALLVATLELARSALIRLQRANDQLKLVSQELSHRIQNIFAIVSGLISLSARDHPEANVYAEGLQARVRALGRAHEFVRPHSPESRDTIAATTLVNLLETLFKPYGGPDGERVSLSGVDAPVDAMAATPLALLFHELATNAMKYGALSRPDGRVEVLTVDDGDLLRLTWTEIGGPSAEQPPDRTGFGSRLVGMSAERQLGGSLSRHWTSQGLRVAISLPRSRLSRQAV
jgi:two-component sensor histidine kinase